MLEEETSLPVVQAAVQLLSPKDSSQVVGTVTDEEGRFSLNVPSGAYLARISYIGFVTRLMDVSVPNAGGLDLDRILLAPDALWLDQAVITASVPLVSTVADTVVYNPAALILADDAMLDDVLKRIPGMEVDEKGNVTLHGKEVKQLLVNGKKFFGGDVASGLKNLPAEMIENIRAYDRASEMKRISGVDDGEDEPVIDVRIKPAFLRGWNNRLTAGLGTKWRYTGRLNANRMTDSSQVTIVASGLNLPNPNRFNSKSNQFGTGSSGENKRGEAGVTFSQDRPKADLGGSVHYDYSFRDPVTSSRTENIYSSGNTFTLGSGIGDVDKHSFKADGNFEFKPSRKWNFLVKPVLTYSLTDSRNLISNTNYLTEECLADDRVYLSDNVSRSIQKRLNANLTFQVYRRLNDRGRGVTFRTYLEYLHNNDDYVTDNSTRYYRISKNPDSTRVYKRYQNTEVNSAQVSAFFTWNEPLAKGMFLQMQYRFQYRFYLTDRDAYKMEDDYPDWHLKDRLSGSFRNTLPSGYEAFFDPSKSSLGRYDYFANYLMINYRLIKKKFNLTAGVVLVPQNTRLRYPDDESNVRDTTTFCFGAAPNLTLRWNPDKQQNLSLSYKSWTSPVNTNYLLSVPNGNNPLYTREGNPGLKPAFTHNANLSYTRSDRKRQNSLTTSANFKLIQNAVSMSTSYDASSGARVVKPLNVDGNWSADASIVFNDTFGNSGFSFTTNTKLEYSNNIAFLYNHSSKVDERNVMRRAMGIERLSGTYRNSWLELTLNGAGLYTLERSALRPSMNQSPWAVSAGVNVIFRMPWKMTLSSDFTDWSQRGYVYDELNRNYLLWNAQLSQSFLKGRLSLSVDWRDILRQQENMVRSFSAERRSVTMETGSVNSYILFKLSWRFKVK